MSSSHAVLRLTGRETDALHSLLAIVLNDPDFAEAAALDEGEWRALSRVMSKNHAARAEATR